MRLLLVEDDHLEARRVKTALRTAFPSCDVELISTEHAFRDRFEATVALRPDVVLMDLMLRWTDPSPAMPVVPEDVKNGGHWNAGARCCRMLLSDPRTQNIPIIIYSAVDQRTLDRATQGSPETVFPIRKDRDEETVIRLLRGVLHSRGQLETQDRVFIAHGHDDESKEMLARVLEHLGLRAIVLHEQPNRGQTIIEKFEQHSGVDFAVVLMTPDDVGGSAAHSDQLNPRARQNVVFELGFFIAKLGRANVCALYKPGVEIPGDYMGVLFIPMDSAGAWKYQLAAEMKAAGLRIDVNRLTQG